MDGLIFEYTGTISKQVIDEKMKELAAKVEYQYQNLDWLSKAFYSKIAYESKKEKYANSPMATLGDRVLSLIIAEKLFDEEKSSKEITDEKAKRESNDQWLKINNKYGLFHYAFNDICFFDEAKNSQGKSNSKEQLSNSKHNRYFEALIGAIYKDLGFNATKEYVLSIL